MAMAANPLALLAVSSGPDRQWVPLQIDAELALAKRSREPAAEDRTASTPAALPLKSVTQAETNLAAYLPVQAGANEPVVKSAGKNAAQ